MPAPTARKSLQLALRLANRLGSARVMRLTAHESHLPERAQHLMSAVAGGTSIPAPDTTGRTVLRQKTQLRLAEQRKTEQGKIEQGKNANNATGASDAPLAAPSLHKSLRPFRLLAMPEPIAVIAQVPEGPPLQFIWRRVTHRVIRSQGPERIAPEWWRLSGDAAEYSATGLPPHRSSIDQRPRDYYRVEDNIGRRYWIFRNGLYEDDGNHYAAATDVPVSPRLEPALLKRDARDGVYPDTPIPQVDLIKQTDPVKPTSLAKQTSAAKGGEDAAPAQRLTDNASLSLCSSSPPRSSSMSCPGSFVTR